MKGGKMMLTEFRLKVYVLKNIPMKEALESISKLLDTCLVTSGYTQLHEENQMKLYTFSSFYPLAQEGIYQAGNIYSIIIRTLDEDIAAVLEKNLDKQCTTYIKALTSEKRVIKQKHLDEIFSITPIIIKFKDEGYWRENHNMEEFEKRLKIGLIKKYNAIHNTKIDEDFEWIHYMKVTNRKPIATAYKGIQLLGDKVSIKVAENPIAQELAWIAVGSSIGEMPARGFGFMNYRYL